MNHSKHIKSCIFEGKVRHERFSPVEHSFQYSLFMLYLDLHELPTLFRNYWLWSYEGFGIARFRRRDHLKELDTQLNLESAVQQLIREKTGKVANGPVRLLTHLEYFGYRFNPVSFYYIFDKDDTQVEFIIAEINNTPWGEQHCYVLSTQSDLEDFRFNFSKEFHISPFMGMDTEYVWRFMPPNERLAIHMENHAETEKYFQASMSMQRKEITSTALTRVLAYYPFMTGKVVAAIYWQALKLWWKGCSYYPHPDNSKHPTVSDVQHTD